jgi:phosphoribosylformylglycinamidine synthase subunit PurS
MLAKIHVTYKEGVLDPQGQAVHHALTDLGYTEVKQVTVGKYMEVFMDGLSEDEAQVRVREMCEKLLANTVIESYQITLSPTQ